ncbi:MAG TPA: VTT domain-containing protein [Acidobacteriota bacterium]
MNKKTEAGIQPPGDRLGQSEKEELYRRLQATFRQKQVHPRLRALIVILEAAFVLGLLIWWLSSKSLQQSRSLWVLFLYCFPAEFIITTVPHEPVILFFSKFYPPLTVTVVSMAGLILIEIINYTAFQYVADLRTFRRTLESRIVQKAVALFNKAPFLTLWLCGLTPLPFFPLRFLVVLARYPLGKYLLAVLTSRFPQIYIVALVGVIFKIPNEWIIALFVLFLAVGLAPVIWHVLKEKRRNKPADPGTG